MLISYILPILRGLSSLVLVPDPPTCSWWEGLRPQVGGSCTDTTYSTSS